MLAGIEPSEAPCCILVEKQRHLAVFLVGLGGFRRLHLNGFIILHTLATHHVFIQSSAYARSGCSSDTMQ